MVSSPCLQHLQGQSFLTHSFLTAIFGQDHLGRTDDPVREPSLATGAGLPRILNQCLGFLVHLNLSLPLGTGSLFMGSVAREIEPMLQQNSRHTL